MTRNIEHRIVSGDAASQLAIQVLDESGAGGANHLYHITGFNSGSNASHPWFAPEHNHRPSAWPLGTDPRTHRAGR